jgi:hypothetical protein
MTPDIQPDEQVLFSRRMSLIGALTHPKAVWTLWILTPFIYFGSRYVITDRRIYSRNGLVSRNTSEIEVNDLQNYQVQQGTFSRLTLFGNASFTDEGGESVVFRRTRRPKKAYKTAKKAKREAH